MRKITLFLLLMLSLSIQAANKIGHFFLKFAEGQVSATNVEANFSWWFKLPEGTEWREVSRTTDYLGMERVEYRQYVGGVEVENSQILLHVKDGMVRSINGTVMEAHRTPVKLRSHSVIFKEKTPTTLVGEKLLFVNTANGYRYAYKMLSENRRYWIFRDAETGEIIKRLPRINHAFYIEGTPTTSTARTIYSGDVEMDVTDVDGTPYLWDQKHNIYTLNGSLLPTFDDLISSGKLYTYFPQGNLPDNPGDATPEQLDEWMENIQELAGTNMLPMFFDYIIDNTSVISDQSGSWKAFQINNVQLLQVNKKEGGDIVPVDISTDVNKYLIGIELCYGADLAHPTYGKIEETVLPLLFIGKPFDLSAMGEVLPYEGATLRLTLQNAESLSEPQLLAEVPIVPNSSGKMEFSNEYVSFVLTYESAGNPVADIHWGMGQTLDFYKQKLGRDSYDGNGAPVYNVTYISNDDDDSPLGFDMCNAGALGTIYPYPMIYGLGSVSGPMKPVVELSVLGHEFTHIITGNTSQLQGLGEAGALNEGFSDIMGITIKKNVMNSDDWFIGGGGLMVETSNMRDLANPENSMDGQDPNPDTYQGKHWVDPEDEEKDQGGVHSNCCVLTKMYYLLCEGGDGTNDNDFAYNVEGIGLDKACELSYLTFTSYATSETDYLDIYDAYLQAASEMFGESSSEYQSVVDAWAAVGIGEGQTDAIALPKAENTSVKAVYDLQGRRLNGVPAQFGIYIVNGKAIVK